MKQALVTTTISVPFALAPYRIANPDVRFFVVGDLKSPHTEIESFCASLSNATYLHPDVQKEWACSELIGWGCVQRRSIGVLEALKWGADVIVYWDDDNLMLDNSYFAHFQHALRIFNGLLADSPTNWFDVGQLLNPISSHRGFPHTKRAPPTFSHITKAKIGVAAGICLGDPDIGAVERIANSPTVHQVSELLRAGIVTDPRNTTTVFNSQNTAFIRELAPAMFMLPGVGRYDDIYASLITQWIMRERGLHVHFGQPFVWQQRNPHDLIKDLKAEIFGMEHIVEFAGYLDKNPLVGRSTFEWLRWLYDDLKACVWWPKQASEAGLAWCDDIEKVL